MEIHQRYIPNIVVMTKFHNIMYIIYILNIILIASNIGEFQKTLNTKIIIIMISESGRKVVKWLFIRQCQECEY